MNVRDAAKVLINCFKHGHKVLLCGNGGSAAECSHFAGELLGRFHAKNRRPLPCINLCADAGVLTCIGNDFGFKEVFARQIEALGEPGDVLVVFSTSGNSENVLAAIGSAIIGGMVVIGVTCGSGGQVGLELGEESILVSENRDTATGQLEHLAFIHEICRLLDREFAETELRRR